MPSRAQPVSVPANIPCGTDARYSRPSRLPRDTSNSGDFPNQSGIIIPSISPHLSSWLSGAFRLAASAPLNETAPATRRRSEWGAMAGMDCLIGFVGKDFAIVAADMNAARSIMVYSQDEDKILKLDSHKLLAVGGDAADCIQEPDFFKKNMDLYAMRNGVPLSTHAAANYMRGEKSYNLRRRMSQVDMLLAGYDKDVGPSLYFIDYLASMQKLDKASHGYGGFFVNRRVRARPFPETTH
eukprot:2425673-Pleurochrysis_carterae.AAC.3